MTINEDPKPIVECQVLKDMLGEDKGYRLCWRRKSRTKVESNIGIDFTVDVDVHPPIKTMFATTKLYFGVLRK